MASIPQSLAGLDPQSRANMAAQMGDVVTFHALAQEGVIPDQDGASAAAVAGHLNILQWLADLGVLPQADLDLTGEVANYGHLDVLQWLARKPEFRSLVFDPNTAHWATRSGHLPIVQWLARKGVLPNQKAVNYASMYGYQDVLDFLAQHGLHPTEYQTLYIVKSNPEGQKIVDSYIA